MDVNEVSAHVVDAAILIHRAFGPGLLESAYLWFLAVELRSRGLRVRLNVPVSLAYKGVQVRCAYRIDMLVEECVVIELKAIKKLLPAHDAQLLSYLQLSHHRVGLLINFHEKLLKDGIRRFIV